MSKNTAHITYIFVEVKTTKTPKNMETNATLQANDTARNSIATTAQQSVNSISRYLRVHLSTILALITSSSVLFQLLNDIQCNLVAIVLATTPTIYYLVRDLTDITGKYRPKHYNPLSHPITAIACSYIAIALSYALATAIIAPFQTT